MRKKDEEISDKEMKWNRFIYKLRTTETIQIQNTENSSCYDIQLSKKKKYRMVFARTYNFKLKPYFWKFTLFLSQLSEIIFGKHSHIQTIFQ